VASVTCCAKACDGYVWGAHPRAVLLKPNLPERVVVYIDTDVVCEPCMPLCGVHPCSLPVVLGVFDLQGLGGETAFYRQVQEVGIQPSAGAELETEVANVANGSYNLKTAVAALVSALLLQPSAGCEVGVVEKGESIDVKFVCLLIMVGLLTIGAGACVGRWCGRRSFDKVVVTPSPSAVPQIVVEGHLTQVVVTPSSSAVTQTIVRRKPRAALVGMSSMAACIDLGHETHVGQNQHAVYISCRRCFQYARWLFSRSDVSFRRHEASKALVDEKYQRGRGAYLALPVVAR
jgi:hypothetical protein